ncbi:sialate:H+ symport family MFS transporter [Streptomyces sp. NBC_01218]|uniref:sialate:H+ symport family MFS transporter n=1 Tax=Streptomyces sp. NBC_01218 TaxID=2903780 RepID=UPI002E13AD8E|nr:sialate:H+ symport family MFS transporter [Streptomyces sp. NBC_01218]
MQKSPTFPWYREVGAARWKSFLAAWTGYVLDGFDFVLITLVLTEVADDFHLSTARAAGLVSGAFVTRWLGGAVLGALGDRYGRRLSMVASILLYSLGTFACGLAWNYESLFAARLAVGMGMAGEYGASATYVLESWPARLRGRASGFLISGFSLGSVLAAQVHDWVVPSLGWRWMFFLGIVPIVIALWMRRALPETGAWTEEAAAREVLPGPLRPLVRTPWLATGNTALAVVAALSLFLVFTPGGEGLVAPLSVAAGLCLLAFAVQMGGRRNGLLYVSMIVTLFFAFLYSWPIQALLPTYLRTELGYSGGQVTGVLTFAGFGTMAGCCAAGFLGDRIGVRKAYALTLLASLVLVAPVFAVRDNVLVLGCLLFLLQATSFGISGLLPRYIGGHFPTRGRGAALGFTYNVGALGGAVAPVLGAHLASGMDLGRALAVLTSAGTVIVVLLIGFDVPARLNRLTDPAASNDHLAAPPNPAATPADRPRGDSRISVT